VLTTGNSSDEMEIPVDSSGSLDASDDDAEVHNSWKNVRDSEVQKVSAVPAPALEEKITLGK